MNLRIEQVLEELRLAGVPVSRRQLLKLAALGGTAISASALLAACGGDDTDATETGDAPSTATGATGNTASPTARSTAAGLVRTAVPEATESAASPTAAEEETASEGGTWTIALTGDPSMNIVTMPGALVDILVYKTMYNNLVKYELTDEGSIVIVGDLAESWESNDELTEYTFTLREGITWHDGTPFTADDVVFTFETVLNPDNNASGRANIASVDHAEAVDATTVKFVLKQPFAALPVMLGYNRVIFPKHLLEGADFASPADYIKNPVGTGPFKFVERVQGSHLELARYDDYFAGKPHLDTVIYKVIPDGNNRVAQAASGEVDFAVIDPPQVQALQGSDIAEVRLAPQVNYYFFAINHSNPLLQDVRVRQALAHGIDQQAIIDNILQGTGERATGPIHPLLGAYYNPDVKTYDYDPEKAAALLAEAGWTKGGDGKLTNAEGQTFPIRFNGPSTYPIMVQVITYAQQQYQDLGFDVSLEIVEWPVHLEMYGAQQYDLLMQWWITPPDPDIYPHYHTEVNNRWKYSNAQADELMVQARSEPDVETRIDLYHQLQTLLAEDVPVVYLYYPQEVQVVSTRSKGLPLMGYRDMLTWMHQAWVQE